MIYPHVHDSARFLPLSKGGAVLESKRPAMSLVATRGPDQQPLYRSDLWL